MLTWNAALRQTFFEQRLDVHVDILRHGPADANESSAYRALITGALGLSDLFDVEDRPICRPASLQMQLEYNAGHWYSHPITNHLYWEPHGCRLRRLTAYEARQCLSGRHLGFVGDSISR